MLYENIRHTGACIFVVSGTVSDNRHILVGVVDHPPDRFIIVRVKPDTAFDLFLAALIDFRLTQIKDDELFLLHLLFQFFR